MSSAQGPGVGTTGALDEVAGLVSRWRRARGSMDRVRVIASGTRTLGSMSADDRRVLAQAVAERGAPEIAERLGPPGGGGPSSSELTELTRALLSVDRDQLDGLAASLSDPDERHRLLLAAAGADPDGAPPPPPSGSAVPLPPPPDGPPPPEPSHQQRAEPDLPPLREAPELSSTALGSADLGAADLGTADLGTADLGAADLGAAGLGTAGLGSAGLVAAGPEPGPAPRPEPAPRPVATRRRTRPRPGSPRAASTSAPEPSSPSGAPTEPGPANDAGHEVAPDVAPAPPVPTVPVGEVLDAIERATSARDRLLAVARVEGASLRAEDLDALLGLLPDGWQRRTAAVRLVAGGGVTHLDPAATVTLFARDSDRIAVAGALVDAGLAHPDALAAALPTRAADRLRRRVGR